MNRFIIAILIFSFSFLSGQNSHSASKLTSLQIKNILIQESIESYPGRCPCPYNADSRGNSCGRRSAYSRGGGYSPLCYPNDVSRSEVEQFRQQRGL